MKKAFSDHHVESAVDRVFFWPVMPSPLNNGDETIFPKSYFKQFVNKTIKHHLFDLYFENVWIVVMTKGSKQEGGGQGGTKNIF